MSYNEIQLKKRISALAKEAREKSGLSRPALAERAGVSVKTLYSFESAATWPQATRLAAISKAIGWDYEKIERVLNSERDPEELTVWDLKGDPWGDERPRHVSDFSDEELLMELTARFQQRNLEIRKLREAQNVVPIKRDFDESIPHAAHPPLRMETSQYDNLGEDPQS